MSAANQEYIDRFNTYKSRLDSAGSAVIRATQYLVRPTDGFPTHSHPTIGEKWREWRDEEQSFYRMTETGSAPARVFPMPPEGGAPPPCWHMWGLLIQAQVDGTHGKAEFLRKIVAEIAADEECPSHPSTCPCKLPENPWVSPPDVKILAPLNVKHSPKCQCGGYRRCTEMEAALAAKKASIQQAATEVVEAPKTPVSYAHNRETCACVSCYYNRVSSGTQDEYMKRCREASDAATARVAGGTKPQSIWAAAAAADAAIAKASAAAGGIEKPDFVKELFTAMGTPHDSTCPHGVPFYSCMPCSH